MLQIFEAMRRAEAITKDDSETSLVPAVYYYDNVWPHRRRSKLTNAYQPTAEARHYCVKMVIRYEAVSPSGFNLCAGHESLRRPE